MKNGDEKPRTAADIARELTELARQRAEKQTVMAAAARGIASESLAVFRKESGAEKRRKEHEESREAAILELAHYELIEHALTQERQALEAAEAEADRKQHAEEGKKQAGELVHAFRGLDHAVKNAVTAFRDARALVDQARQRGYFAVGRDHSDTLMADALHTGLQGLNFDHFKIPYIEPMRRRSFGEIGDRWAVAMRGRADQVITGPPVTPPVTPTAPPPAAAVSSVPEQPPPAVSAKPPKRGDLTKSMPGDFALGGFKVYANKQEADAAHERARQGGSS